MGKLANVFALRFRGVDPERFLNWLYKYTGWFFTLADGAVRDAVRALRHWRWWWCKFDEFQRRLPAFHQFFGPKNWFYLGITMGDGEGAARVRPRPVVQAFRRRMSRAGRR